MEGTWSAAPGAASGRTFEAWWVIILAWTHSGAGLSPLVRRVQAVQKLPLGRSGDLRLFSPLEMLAGGSS